MINTSNPVRYVRPLFHISPISGLTNIESKRSITIERANRSTLTAAESFLENVRQAEFPSRPSRLTSTYFSPNVRGQIGYNLAHQGKANFYAAFVPKAKAKFVTNMDLVGEVHAALHTGDTTSALSHARNYWTGPRSFGELRKLIKRKSGEVLLESGVPVQSFAVKTIKKDTKFVPIIEGLAHGGAAERIRKILTSFGSGWRGNNINSAKSIMRSGEGAAISMAGTATIPAVLKNTSRIIKNSL
jgi:hypothetical protein